MVKKSKTRNDTSNIKSKKVKFDKQKYCEFSENFNKGYKMDTNFTFELFKKISRVAEHSSIYHPIKIPDTCTDINIWKYEVYRDGKLIKSKNPITTSDKYKKKRGLPFLISCSLFGSKSKYVDGMIRLLESMKFHGLSKYWDVRVYIASRKDGKTVKLSVPKEFQTILLKHGVELAHVDNGNPNGYSLEGTFWRMCALNEKARILIKDVDDIFTAHDLIALAEWIESKLTWFRIFHFRVQISPLILCCIGAIGGPNLIKNLNDKIKFFPYKKKYGDDEIFASYVLFADVLKNDNICTHYYPYKTLLLKPNNDSSFFPTNKYIYKITGIPISDQKSIDIKLPPYYRNEIFGQINTNLTTKFINKNKRYLSLYYYGNRGKNAMKILKIKNIELHKTGKIN